MRQREDEWGEVVRVRVGDLAIPIEDSFGMVHVGLGGMPFLAYEEADALRQKLEKSWAE